MYFVQMLFLEIDLTGFASTALLLTIIYYHSTNIFPGKKIAKTHLVCVERRRSRGVRWKAQACQASGHGLDGHGSSLRIHRPTGGLHRCCFRLVVQGVTGLYSGYSNGGRSPDDWQGTTEGYPRGCLLSTTRPGFRAKDCSL